MGTRDPDLGDRGRPGTEALAVAADRVAGEDRQLELMLRDADLFSGKQQHFDLVVLDEAQRIKNRASTTSQVVRSIRRTVPGR